MVKPHTKVSYYDFFLNNGNDSSINSNQDYSRNGAGEFVDDGAYVFIIGRR